jgi:hypothetical protein
VNSALALVDAIKGDQIVAAKLVAVGSNEVDFTRQILASDVPVRGVPTGDEVDLKDFPCKSGRLALDAVQTVPDAKDEIGTRMLGDRLEDLDAVLDGFERNGHLADRPSEVGIHHEPMFATTVDGKGLEPSRRCDGFEADE